MSDIQLNELITAYADNELTSSESEALLAQASAHPQIKKAIDREIRFKTFLKEKLKPASMPLDVRNKVLSRVKELKQEHLTDQQTENISNTVTSTPITPIKSKKSTYSTWLRVAALVLVGVMLYFATKSTPAPAVQFETVEYVSFQHFSNHNGSFLEPTITAATTTEAQQILKELYGCDIVVPELDGATFEGIVYADFHNGYKTPLLEYMVSEGDYIYIFAFELKDLEKHDILVRDEQAVASIIQHNDVFSVRFNGHDVVSWKWGNVWYSAISHHDGEVIAAMLPH
jgi:hypothetical protein